MEVALHRWLLRAAPFSIILASEIRASCERGASLRRRGRCGEKEHHHSRREQAKATLDREIGNGCLRSAQNDNKAAAFLMGGRRF